MKNQKILLATTLILAGCTGTKAPSELPKSSQDKRQFDFGSVLGEEGLTFGSDRKIGASTNVDYSKISVNPYLWQASIQTLNEIPLVACDAVGGMIITDWYTPSDINENERIKVSVYLVGKELRANGVKVTLHKQIRNNGQWQNVDADQAFATKIEDIILSQARRIKIKSKQ